jgi:hypothetical protein
VTRVQITESVRGIRTVRIWREPTTQLPRRFEFSDEELLALAGEVAQTKRFDGTYEFADVIWPQGNPTKLAEFINEGWELLYAYPRTKPHAPEDGIYWYALLRRKATAKA